jgi:hypothetical protein
VVESVPVTDGDEVSDVEHEVVDDNEDVNVCEADFDFVIVSVGENVLDEVLVVDGESARDIEIVGDRDKETETVLDTLTEIVREKLTVIEFEGDFEMEYE